MKKGQKSTGSSGTGLRRPFNCPAELTLALIGGKWKAILLYNLRRGPVRFGELKRLSPGITAATLSAQLKELEEHGLVSRRLAGTAPTLAVEYSLTPLGETLKPVLYAAIKWGLGNRERYVLGEFGMAKFQR